MPYQAKTSIPAGLWSNLAMISGLGPDDPGSNPGSLILILERSETYRAEHLNYKKDF